MKIVCICVGKKHDKDLVSAIDKYQTRLNSYTDFEFELIPPSERFKESNLILKKLKDDDFVILLDEKGRQLNNSGLAQLISDSQTKSLKRLVFIIGGAYGVNEKLMKRSDRTVSVSGLVFPHQLMRLILVEQLYRSFNMLAGGKYHHE
jgi:23S rRNA (pseudouridine1915-N3)-methyltransferase